MSKENLKIKSQKPKPQIKTKNFWIFCCGFRFFVLGFDLTFDI